MIKFIVNLFKGRKQQCNIPVVRHSNVSAKILYSNCQTIQDGLYRYTIDLNEHIQMDKMDEIISNGIK